MRIDTLDKLIWTLVYGGLLGVCLGLFLLTGSAALAWACIGIGAAVAAIGAALVWVRSRRPDPSP
jgi:hypothetical protein